MSISDIGNRVNPKSYILLDSRNGNGLKVYYTFLSLLCIPVTCLCRMSTEPILEVNLEDEEEMKVSDSAQQTLVGKQRGLSRFGYITEV